MENYGFLMGLAYLGAVGLFGVYIGSQQLILRKCAPQRRTMRPAMVWLQAVPCFGALWQFFVTRGLARSLANEWRFLGFSVSPDRLVRLGAWKSAVDVAALLHVLAFGAVLVWMESFTGRLFQVLFAYTVWAASVLQLASVVMWGVYWSRISEQSRQLIIWTRAQTFAR